MKKEWLDYVNESKKEELKKMRYGMAPIGDITGWMKHVILSKEDL